MKAKSLFIIFLSLLLTLCSTLLISSTINNKKNKALADSRTDLIEAGMQRAEYMYQYRWTPTKNLTGWGTTFYAGNSYTVPYSQPYYYAGYIFYDITLAQFEEYALNGTNGFYDAHNNNGNTRACPRYGIDCSGFVSFCIGSKRRYTTYYIKEYANSNQNGFYNKSWETATRGDILNCNDSNRQHVLMIKEVSGDNITTYESTPGYSMGYQDIRVRTQTKTQWANDGYNVVGHDYTTNCGGSPKDDVTGRSLGLPVKINTVLGSCQTNNVSSSWDRTNAFNTSSENFDSRKVSISTFVGNDAIYFNQSNSTNLKVGATFKTTGKTSSELYGKFGIGFFNSAGKGLFTYVDAFGTNGTNLSNITGTNVGVVAKNPSVSDQWDWKASTNYDIATNVYSSSSPIQIEIERKGVTFDIYVNGSLVKTINGSNYYLSATENIYPCILTFNTCIEVTNYYSVATHDSLTIDGDLQDWQNLNSWAYIDANKKQALDKRSTKGVTFYTRWTDSGLFIYAIAKHAWNPTGNGDWWQNTNFEIIINEDDSASQYYAISSQVRGFDSFYFKTSGTNGNYTSVLEAFIADCELFDNGINVGLAFKIRDYTNGIYDDIFPQGLTTYTDYWWAENKDPHTLPFALENEANIVIPEPPSSSSSSVSSNVTNNTSNASSNITSISNEQSKTSSSEKSTYSTTSSMSSQEVTSNSTVTNSETSTEYSSTNNTSNSSTEGLTPSNNGCGASLNVIYLLPFAFIAIILIINKQKNN